MNEDKPLLSDRVFHWWLGISIAVMLIGIVVGLSLTRETIEGRIFGVIGCFGALSAGCCAIAKSEDNKVE